MLILEALLILFPFLAALVLHFLLAIEVSLLASVEALFVTVLFLHHGSISIVLSLLLLFLLTFGLLTIIALLLLHESLAFFILAFAFLLECLGKSLSLTVATSVRVERGVIVFLLLLNNSLSFLELCILPLSASLLVLSLFFSGKFAGFFFSSSIGLLLLALHLVGVASLLVKFAFMLFAGLASGRLLASLHFFFVSTQVVGLLPELVFLSKSVLLPLILSAPFVL